MNFVEFLLVNRWLKMFSHFDFVVAFKTRSEFVGGEIPYKSFGYNTLLDFIRESGEFDWYSTNEGIQINARVSQNSQHIVNLVGSQNRDRRKKSTKSMPFRPQFNSRQVCTSDFVLFVLFPVLLTTFTVNKRVWLESVPIF